MCRTIFCNADELNVIGDFREILSVSRCCFASRQRTSFLVENSFPLCRSSSLRVLHEWRPSNASLAYATVAPCTPPEIIFHIPSRERRTAEGLRDAEALLRHLLQVLVHNERRFHHKPRSCRLASALCSCAEWSIVSSGHFIPRCEQYIRYS